MLGKKPAIEWFAPDKLPGSGAPGELPITCDNFSPAERHHRNALTHHPFKGTVVTIIMQMRMTDVGALLGVKNYDIGIGAKAKMPLFWPHAEQLRRQCTSNFHETRRADTPLHHAFREHELHAVFSARHAVRTATEITLRLFETKAIRKVAMIRTDGVDTAIDDTRP